MKEFTPRTGSGCVGFETRNRYKSAAMSPNRAGTTKRCARRWARRMRTQVARKAA